ncbi:MAG TPA: hypothetical protein VF541_10975 [Longimicrobium sp.]|jgi:hypothetical protein
MRGTGCVTAGLAILLAMIGGRADAQQVDRGLQADTAGVPADTVRLASTRVRELERCHVLGFRVVDGDSAVAAMHRWPQCRDADFGDLRRRTLVGLPMHGDCHARHAVDAWRSDSRREYRVRVTTLYGGCRAARFDYTWLALPKLPPGWRIGFTTASREADGDERPVMERIALPQPPG